MASITYLSKKNQPTRITPKKYASFKRAKRESLSANEGYNTSVLGISSLEYAWIREAVYRVSGICIELATLKSINAWFADPAYLTDDQGRYLTYMGKPVAVSVS